MGLSQREVAGSPQPAVVMNIGTKLTCCVSKVLIYVFSPGYQGTDAADVPAAIEDQPERLRL